MTIDIGFERFVLLLLLVGVVLVGYIGLTGELTIRPVPLCVLMLIAYPLSRLHPENGVALRRSARTVRWFFYQKGYSSRSKKDGSRLNELLSAHQ